jgi:hypothetical protein
MYEWRKNNNRSESDTGSQSGYEPNTRRNDRNCEWLLSCTWSKTPWNMNLRSFRLLCLHKQEEWLLSCTWSKTPWNMNLRSFRLLLVCLHKQEDVINPRTLRHLCATCWLSVETKDKVKQIFVTSSDLLLPLTSNWFPLSGKTASISDYLRLSLRLRYSRCKHMTKTEIDMYLYDRKSLRTDSWFQERSMWYVCFCFRGPVSVRRRQNSSFWTNLSGSRPAWCQGRTPSSLLRVPGDFIPVPRLPEVMLVLIMVLYRAQLTLQNKDQLFFSLAIPKFDRGHPVV